MKLTNILFRWKRRLPRGNIWRGKDKLYKKVTPQILENKLHEFEIEEENMFYLRHPYLTPEQSFAHGTAIFKHHEKFIEKHREERLKWKGHKSLGDRFGFLRVAEAWE